MQTSHHFVIGDGHEFCQDFALSGVTNDLAYAIVCDGCSMAKDSDVGARFLALAAQETIKQLATTSMTRQDFRAHLEKGIMDKLLFDVIPKFSVTPDALCATLVIAIVHKTNKNLNCFMMWGDGVALVEYVDGMVRTHDVEYTTNAPYYFVYGENAARYQEEFPGEKIVTYRDFDNCGMMIQELHSPQQLTKPSVIPLLGDIKQVTIFSDGVKTFYNKDNDAEQPDVRQIPFGITRYKTTAGEFLQRRMNAYRRQMHKVGVVHFDDLGAASILL